MDTLQLVSIFLEVAIVIISLMLALGKGKKYGWGFALTFAIYVFYDLAKLYLLSIPNSALYPSFFVATISALLAVWSLYKKT
ncbi:MAG: hypothetical protein Q7R98_03135 [Candidatus Jorgensenbacteria bacterium]|nr:hypothetical protein [Candidatus Jorgensenbacteria bacterium]